VSALDRAIGLCLIVCARYGVSGDSLRMALMGCEREPKRAYDCYRAILNSIPRAQR
jgi:hypothetical protein